MRRLTSISSWSPAGVPQRVVDLLEAIEVHQRDREQRAAASGVADGLIDPLAKQDPVGQTGERVVQGLVLVELGLADQVALGAFALGDVLDHGDSARSVLAISVLEHRS